MYPDIQVQNYFSTVNLFVFPLLSILHGLNNIIISFFYYISYRILLIIYGVSMYDLHEERKQLIALFKLTEVFTEVASVANNRN